MPDSPDIVILIFGLLPGLIGYGLYQALTPTRPPTWTTRFVMAIVLSILSYVELSVLANCLAWLPHPQALSAATTQGDLKAVLSLEPLFAVISASVLVVPNAVVLVLCHNFQVLHRIAALCHLTAKTGFSSNWDDVLWSYRRNHWVMVSFEDGIALTGWILRNSDASDERSLLLSRITQYDPDGAHFSWPPEEKVFLGSLTGVKYLRLIPEQEFIHGQERQQSGRQAASKLGDSETKNGPHD